MSTHGATKMTRVVANSHAIIAIELICASQGIDLGGQTLRHQGLGAGTQVAWDLIRRHVPFTGEDQFQAPHIEQVRRLVQSGELKHAVEATVGPLL